MGGRGRGEGAGRGLGAWHALLPYPGQVSQDSGDHEEVWGRGGGVVRPHGEIQRGPGRASGGGRGGGGMWCAPAGLVGVAHGHEAAGGEVYLVVHGVGGVGGAGSQAGLADQTGAAAVWQRRPGPPAPPPPSPGISAVQCTQADNAR